MLFHGVTKEWVEKLNTISTDERLARVLDTFDLVIDPEDDSVAQHLLNDGYWESWITAWMAGVIQPDRNCLDLGANFGYYTGVMSELSKGIVVAIEANPVIAKMLTESININKWYNTAVVGCGVGAEKSTLTLTMNHHLQGSGSLMLSRDFFSDWGDDIIEMEVPVLPLDSIVDEKTEWDLIKIDVEGFEPEVFMGGSKTFARGNPVIAIEITRHHPADFLDWLFDHYDVTDIGLDGSEWLISRQEVSEKDWCMLVLRNRR